MQTILLPTNIHQIESMERLCCSFQLRSVMFKVFLATLVCASALVFFPGSASAQAGDISNHQTDVSLATALPAHRRLTLTGYTRARHVLDIISEESARCVKVNGDVGDFIGESGIFAELDTTFIDIEIKRNQVQQKKSLNRIDFLKTELKRRVKLAEQEAVAVSALDRFQNDLDQERLQLETLKVEEVNLLERRKRFHIRVPASWRIIERRLEPGEWAAVGENLGKAGDFSSLLVPFAFELEEYQWIKKKNGPIFLLFPDQSAGGIEIAASIERISPDFDPETRKINLDLIIKQGLPEMRAGLRAELVIRLPDTSGAVLVAKAALEKRYESYWLTRPDGERVNVVLLGDGPDDTYRVRSPKIEAGDRFLLKANPDR